MEFIELKQCDLTIFEYEVKFLRLSCYALSIVVSDQEKSFHFQEGLRYDLKVHVALHQERMFEALVENTKII